MPLTALQTLKLKHYQTKLGPMTADEAMSRALEYDATARDVGVFDPAHSHFHHEQHVYVEYAELLTSQEEAKAQSATQ